MYILKQYIYNYMYTVYTVHTYPYYIYIYIYIYKWDDPLGTLPLKRSVSDDK